MAKKLNIIVVPLKNRLMAKTVKIPRVTGCWLWTGYISPYGYGQIYGGPKSKPRMIQAHVASYMVHKGVVTPGYDVMHSCDVRNCVNPDHLSLGTRKQNMADAVNKNRLRRGVKHYKCILTDEQVREIRTLPRYYGCHTEYSRIYRISRELMRDIIHGKRRASLL